MARIDKVAPGVGNFRGTSKSDVASTHWNQIRGVGVDVNGLAEIGPSVSGILGVSIWDQTTRFAKSRIDIMTVGEIVELGAGYAPGQKVYISNVDGTPSAVAGNAAAPANSRYLGTVMDDSRLVVRFAQS
jgi:hypothetical protein